MEDWKIVACDGNPEKEGIYDCVLIHEKKELKDPAALNTGNEEWISTGKLYAVRDSRWFGPAKPNDGWLMKGQPKEGLAWHEESGSYMDEYVYAWLPQRKVPDIQLPEGVEWDEDEL